ncbi:hypothetical protein PIROE2DRAFT_10571 [Piromyces sp. E2]|nr:hypothetical protein PIROE2DRAFT_10571 [Piromyces sp. E2]|eukprot:OUM62993.1 hypothetical protein PIROE2DRAFT_10571 [Piromyces sp. E2]
MGFIIDCQRISKKFTNLVGKDFFVDKSGIINKFNEAMMQNGGNNISITKPRRFGKSSIAAMLVAYYSKGIDSKQIFDRLKVYKEIAPDHNKKTDTKIVSDDQKDFDKNSSDENSSDENNSDENSSDENNSITKKEKLKRYKEFQNKYHTLYFDFSRNIYSKETLKEYLDSINQELKEDIEELYPNSKVLKKYSKEINRNLEKLNNEIGVDFVLVIDEWDYIIASKKFTRKERDDYISFLKDLIKDQGYAAFVYVTGILPLAKEITQSTINCFSEYSMLDDEEYYQYFGFTEQEVRDLCKKNNTLKYEYLEKWYNGYKSNNGESIFNTWSVIQALRRKKLKNYWIQTGRFDELINVVNFRINGVDNDIIKLIKGEEISVNLGQFGADNFLKELENNKEENNDIHKEELYSKMVTLGFLTYYNGKISIPNIELLENYVRGFRQKNNILSFFYELMEHSKEILKVTLDKDAKAVCELFKKSHMKRITPGDVLDHGGLKRIVDFAYFYAQATYDIKEEVGIGAGKVDFIFYPKRDKNEPVIILELKRDKTVESAIKQIHDKYYSFGLKDEGYKGNVLRIGINCKNEKREYSCIIEEYSCDKEFKTSSKYNPSNISSNEQNPLVETSTKQGPVPSKSKKNKRKNTIVSDESDGIYKRLRSKQKKQN